MRFVSLCAVIIVFIMEPVIVRGQCPMDSDSLQYWNPSGSIVAYQMPLPTPWWAVRMSPGFVTRVDSAYAGYGILKAPGSYNLGDTLQFRVLDNTLPTIKVLHQGQFIIPPGFSNVVDDDYYLIDYTYLGTYPMISPAHDFWFSWRLKGPASHTGRILMRQPALNPDRSVVIGNFGDTTVVSTYVLAQIPTPVDLWAETRPCYINGVPVELASFTAEYLGREVRLEWTTATETNNAGFEVERAIPSQDGGALLWQRIAFVSGNGTSREEHRYAYDDPTAVQLGDRSGVLRYRLRQIDFDGAVHLTPVREVRIPSAMNGFELLPSYPNPATRAQAGVVVSFVAPVAARMSITLFDAAGRNVRTLFDGTHEAGFGSLSFDASKLEPGAYWCVLAAEGALVARRMLVTR